MATIIHPCLDHKYKQLPNYNHIINTQQSLKIISLRLLSSKTCCRQNNLSKYNRYLINKQDSERCTVKWWSCSTKQSSVRISLENVWSYTSISPYTCMVQCLVRHPNRPISTNTDLTPSHYAHLSVQIKNWMLLPSIPGIIIIITIIVVAVVTTVITAM